FIDEIMEIRSPVLGGATAAEVVGNDRYCAQLTGLALYAEGLQLQTPSSAWIDGLYQRLGLTRPKSRLENADGKVSEVTLFDIERADPDALSDAKLVEALTMATSSYLVRTVYRLARAIRQRPSLADDANIRFATA